MYSANPRIKLAADHHVKTGWLTPHPDLRDFTDDNPKVSKVVTPLHTTLGASASATVPKSVDLREWCSPIEDQGSLGSCTANAGVAIVEYFEKRAFGKHLDGSRLYVYKNTRNLMGVTGDTGAWLRTTMGALATCGVAPEKYWPYEISNFDESPSPFVYQLGGKFEATSYFCLDPLGAPVPQDKVLAKLKEYLAAGVPAMFGFYGFDSFKDADIPGGIPHPCDGERAQWGHAIAAVGYDDAKAVTNTKCNKKTTGALLIRNSWGTQWGDKGYGWLPYEYVLRKLALDFWVLLKMDWINTGEFGL